VTAEPGTQREFDAESEAWWEATRERRLLVQRCEHCGRHQHYPRMLCIACGGTDLSFVGASGKGTVYSFTVVRRAPSAGFTPPYVIALVRLAEGPLLVTRIVDCEPALVVCDLPVELRWQRLEDGRHLPVFTLAAMRSG
jgi:uncharacterized OB-fold protein